MNPGRRPSLTDYNGFPSGSPRTYADTASHHVLETGPFSGFQLPHESPAANAAFLFRNLISTYLITHPHLDHLSGMAINTAGYQQTSRPKRIAALPSTIEAIKNHIFNDVIWPNMSDEDGGIGFMTYMRLVAGGNDNLGDGAGRGYIEVCDGLTAKGFPVSHGRCTRRSMNHGHESSTFKEASFPSNSGRGSLTSEPPRHELDQICTVDSAAYFLRDDYSGSEVLIFGDVEPDSLSRSPRTSFVWREAAEKIVRGNLTGILIESSYDDSQNDSLLFGHLNPRHLIAELRNLAQMVRNLKSHAPNSNSNTSESPRRGKRKRATLDSNPQHQDFDRGRSSYPMKRTTRSSVSPFTVDSQQTSPAASHPSLDSTAEQPEDDHPPTINAFYSSSTTSNSNPSPASSSSPKPLEGVQVVIIHMKHKMKDGPDVGETILKQLRDHDKEAKLGCGFAISRTGTSIWL